LVAGFYTKLKEFQRLRSQTMRVAVMENAGLAGVILHDLTF